jgi:hypothetical protein
MRESMKRLALPGALALALAACSSSRTTAPPNAAPPPSVAPAPTPAGVPMTPPSHPSPQPSPTVPPSAPGSPVADYREVMKLYRANLSEDFIIDRIRQDHAVYNLTADNVIELRSSGVSERVIQAMLDTSRGAEPMGSAAPRRPAEDRVTIEAPPPAAEAPVRWEGLVRRDSGIVVLKSRFRVGTLTFAEGQIRWLDAKDSSKNLLIPERALSEQFMTCLKKPGGNECFEWGFKTSNGDEYRFRDVTWEQNGNDKVAAVHDYFKNRFPSLIDSQKPVDEK